MVVVGDGRAATFAVKKYFDEAYGVFGAIGFEVDDVGYSEQSKAWTVRCRFFLSLNATQKTPYEVTVAEDGRILKVKKA